MYCVCKRPGRRGVSPGALEVGSNYFAMVWMDNLKGRVNSVLQVKSVSDRVMSVKLEIEAVMMNIFCTCALQVGCELDEMVGGVT